MYLNVNFDPYQIKKNSSIMIKLNEFDDEFNILSIDKDSYVVKAKMKLE